MAKEVYIYGAIEDDFWRQYFGGVSFNSFKADFDAALAEAGDEPIKVRINSPGGLVDEGLAIANFISRAEHDVHTYIDGVAYSMGAIIALSGKKVNMAANTTMLLHSASGGVRGNVSDMEQVIEQMKAVNTGLSESIAAKTGLTVDQVNEKWLDHKDHTLTAREALDAKLIDGIEGEAKDADVPKGVQAMSEQEIMAHFRNSVHQVSQKKADSNLFTWFKNHAPKLTGILNSTGNKQEDDMNLEGLKAAIEDGSITFKDDAQKAQSLEVLKAALKEGEVITDTDHKAVKDQVTAHEQTITDLKAKLKAEEDAKAKVTGEFEAFKASSAGSEEGEGEGGDAGDPKDDSSFDALQETRSYNQKAKEFFG